MASEALVRAIFVLLALATAGAFFLAQRVKSGAPPIERVFFQPVISPNGDGRKDAVTIRFDLPRADRAEVALVDVRGEVFRRLADRRLGTGTHRFVWDGRDDRGRRAPDGAYQLRVRLTDQGRTLLSPRTLTVDTVPPTPRIVAVTPATIVPGTPGRRGRARIRYLGPTDPAPVFVVHESKRTREYRPVARFVGPRFRQTATWDGRSGDGRPVAPGRYYFAVRATDAAGNRSAEISGEGVRVRARP